MSKEKSELQKTYEQLENAFDCRLPKESIERLKKIASGEMKPVSGAEVEPTMEEIVEDIRKKHGDRAAEDFIANEAMRDKLHLR